MSYQKNLFPPTRIPALAALFLLPVFLFGMGAGEMGLLDSTEQEGITELIVETDSYDVNLLGTEGSTTTVEIYGDRAVEPRIRERGGTLRIEAKERRALFSRGGGEGRVDIRTGQRTRIQVISGSGNLDVRRFQDGEVDLRTASGDIEGRALYGDLAIRTASGDIELERIGGEVEVQSSSGEIRLENGEGELILGSSSGSLTLKELTGDIEAESTSGDVEVSGATGRLRLSSTSGDVEGDRLTLNGASSFEAISGDVEIDIEGDPESFNLALASTSGSIRLPGVEVGNRYIRDGGGVGLEVSTVSGNITIR